MGSFRPDNITVDLHTDSNFAKCHSKTVDKSLPDSCRTIFIRQGISLHYNSQV